MDKHITMWVKTECPFCVKARDELFNQKVDHTIYIMDDKLEGLVKLKELWNHSTVPIVVLRVGDDEKLIGGYTDLKDWLGIGTNNND